MNFFRSGTVLLGAILFGLGLLLSKQCQFVGNRPDIWFPVLTAYGLALLGFVALACGIFF